jgi:Cu(I)/Ag(I) efflux system membrane protein CusA/SilA
MKRIATPMIGGVITSTVMELAVYPAIFFLWRSRRFKVFPITTTSISTSKPGKESL